MNTKKITFVISSLSAGGAERVLTTLANKLVEVFDVSVITFYNTNSFYKLDNRIKVFSSLHKEYNKANKLKSIINNYKLLNGLSEAIKQEQPDLVISFMTTANVLSLLACKRLNIPCIISERNHPLHRKPTKFWSIMRRFYYKKSSALVVQTKDIKKYFKDIVPDTKLVIIKNPISPKLALKRKFDNKRDNIILNVGRLEKQKNQGMLIDAFHSLNLSNWKLLLIGDGSLKKQYEEKILNLKLDKNVAFISHVKNIHDYYNTASIFVFSSNFEGFPNALTEALFFGVPSISTDCPTGPSELINDGVNGFLIPVGDTKALTIKLKTLINDNELKSKFSKNAIKSTELYDVSKIAKQWQQLINNILDE